MRTAYNDLRPAAVACGGRSSKWDGANPFLSDSGQSPLPQHTHTQVTVQLQRPGSPVLGPNLTGLGARLSLPVPVASPRHLETPACSGTI